MACVGNIYYMEDIMACHRVVIDEGDSWSAKTYDKNMNLFFYRSHIALSKMIAARFNKSCYDLAYLDFLRTDSFSRLCRDVSFENFRIWLWIVCHYAVDRRKLEKTEAHRFIDRIGKR